VASQLFARRARLPAMSCSPVGFVAGIATDDVHPDVLLGDPLPAVRVGRGGRDPVRGGPAAPVPGGAGTGTSCGGAAHRRGRRGHLARRRADGGAPVLPIVFVAIFGTVVLYGTPARRSEVGVRMRMGPAAEQTAARGAGFDADRGRMMIDAVNREVELRGDHRRRAADAERRLQRGGRRRAPARARPRARLPRRSRPGRTRPPAAVPRAGHPRRPLADVRGARPPSRGGGRAS
jgi:hypothetical protein